MATIQQHMPHNETGRAQKIIELYGMGATEREIAAIINCSKTTVHYWLMKYEILPRRRGPKTTRETGFGARGKALRALFERVSYQMPSGNDTSSFFGNVIPSVGFDEIGDTVRGKVITKELRQQRDFDTGEPLFWQDGRPKNMVVITLETHVATDETDGLENLYVRGLMQPAFIEALRSVKLRDIANGQWLEVALIGRDAPKRRGMEGAKQYGVIVNAPDNPPAWADDNWPPKRGTPEEAQPTEPPF